MRCRRGHCEICGIINAQLVLARRFKFAFGTRIVRVRDEFEVDRKANELRMHGEGIAESTFAFKDDLYVRDFPVRNARNDCSVGIKRFQCRLGVFVLLVFSNPSDGDARIDDEN